MDYGITSDVMYWIELAGIAAFSVSGATVGNNKKLDVFGVVFLGVTTSFGGGLIRDMMLGVVPPAMFSNIVYFLVAAGCSLLTFVYSYFREKFSRSRNLRSQLLNIVDAVGLGAFTVVGVDAAIAVCGNENVWLCAFMGLITAVGGGAVRDVMAHDIPFILYKRIYAVASIAGAVLYFYLLKTGLPHPASVLCSMASVVLIRILATVFRIDLPRAA